MNYPRCPYNVQAKIGSNGEEKWFNDWYASSTNYYYNYFYDIWESNSTTIFFRNKSRVGGVRFRANSIPLDNPIMKVWEYDKVAHLTKIPYPKYPFFSGITKF